ncbi:MAG: hypothetical protein KGL39_17880 [Patescibacteria group bacterium]|nr:hypothetical protein [Patescibacteria group bacterium]
MTGGLTATAVALGVTDAATLAAIGTVGTGMAIGGGVGTVGGLASGEGFGQSLLGGLEGAGMGGVTAGAGSFLGPALGSTLDIGSTAGGALAGAGAGAGYSALTGQDPLTGAITGAVGGGLAGNGMPDTSPGTSGVSGASNLSGGAGIAPDNTSLANTSGASTNMIGGAGGSPSAFGSSAGNTDSILSTMAPPANPATSLDPAVSLFNGGNAPGAGTDLASLIPSSSPVLPSSTSATEALTPSATTSAPTTGATSMSNGIPLGSILSLGSGLMNANAMQNATDQMKKMQAQNIALAAPYQATGTAAASNLSNLLNPGTAASTLASTPGYQFELQQGNNALNNANAASGMAGSGAALKAAQQFGQGLAGTTYNTAVNQNLSAAGLGANALTGAMNANTNLGNVIGMGTLGQAGNVNNTISQILAALGNKNPNQIYV